MVASNNRARVSALRCSWVRRGPRLETAVGNFGDARVSEDPIPDTYQSVCNTATGELGLNRFPLPKSLRRDQDALYGAILAGVGGASTVPRRHFGHRRGRRLPAVVSQPLGDVGAFLGVPQLADVWCGDADVPVRHRSHTVDELPLARQTPRVQGVIAGGIENDPAAYRAVPVNALEQQILSPRGQIPQQALARPGGRRRRGEPRLPPRSWAILAKVDGDVDAVCRRLGTVLTKGRRFEVEHLGLVEFIHAGAVRPGQPPRPGLEARRQEHHLTKPGIGRAQEEVVDEW